MFVSLDALRGAVSRPLGGDAVVDLQWTEGSDAKTMQPNQESRHTMEASFMRFQTVGVLYSFLLSLFNIHEHFSSLPFFCSMFLF